MGAPASATHCQSDATKQRLTLTPFLHPIDCLSEVSSVAGLLVFSFKSTTRSMAGTKAYAVRRAELVATLDGYSSTILGVPKRNLRRWQREASLVATRSRRGWECGAYPPKGADVFDRRRHSEHTVIRSSRSFLSRQNEAA